MRNVHEREIAAPAGVVGLMLDSFASPQDRIWPARWPAAKLDAGLTIGSKGGHGPIRYSVVKYERGHRIRMMFAPGIGIMGCHEFLVEPIDFKRCLVTHTIEGPLNGRMRLLWPLIIRWLHDALLEDLLDNIEDRTSGRRHNGPARWSPWVRLLRALRRTDERSSQVASVEHGCRQVATLGKAPRGPKWPMFVGDPNRAGPGKLHRQDRLIDPPDPNPALH